MVASTGIVSYTDLCRRRRAAEDSKSFTAGDRRGSWPRIDPDRVRLAGRRGACSPRPTPRQREERKGTTRSHSETPTPRSTSPCWCPIAATASSGQLRAVGLHRHRHQQHEVTATRRGGRDGRYYFFYGPSIDQVVAGTGPRPARRRVPNGRTACFNPGQYGSQTELLNVKNGYRNNNSPSIASSRIGTTGPRTRGARTHGRGRYPDPASLVTADAHRQRPR